MNYYRAIHPYVHQYTHTKSIPVVTNFEMPGDLFSDYSLSSTIIVATKN